ncbi:MAG: integral rane transferase [Verrucomicrobiales bacterium]|nr:integral rane transferase [Verrucomicrobiales bacterium]
MGYTIGSVLAPFCYRAGFSPNTVTVMSLLTAVLAVVPVAYDMFPGPASAGLYLGAMLLISFGLDCSDGILARVTRQSSPFGQLWDKLLDLLSLYVIGIVCGFAARNSPPAIPLIADYWDIAFPLLLMWSVTPKTVFSVFGWLKDQQLNNMSRVVDAKHLSGADYARRIAGNLVDEPVFRLGVGISWMMGLYWEYIIFYHGIVAVMCTLYVADTWWKLTRNPTTSD